MGQERGGATPLLGEPCGKITALSRAWEQSMRTAIKLLLLTHTHTCAPSLAVPKRPEFISSRAFSRAASLRVPLGTSFSGAPITSADAGLTHPRGWGGNLPCTCDAVVPTCSGTQVARVPPLLLLAREVGQNTCIGPAQAFTASDGAEGSQSCFISLVFFSLFEKREKGRSVSSTGSGGDTGEPSSYLLGSPGASM